MHEQKFKDLLSSTCQDRVERIVLDLESEAAWLLFPPGVTFYHRIFFHVVKPLMSNIVIIANFVTLQKNSIHIEQVWTCPGGRGYRYSEVQVEQV